MKNRNVDDGRSWGFEFTVRNFRANTRLEEGSFEAAMPYRNHVYKGRTVEEAVGAMLKGTALLAREGSLDPNLPWECGVPVIQHVIHVLTERLLWHVERRREHLTAEGSADQPGERERAVNRDNEIISALGTSIAALARVKDL